MKIKSISRDVEDFTRETVNDHKKEFYSKDPTLHKFERPREYVRALNASKVTKIYAKPFLGALDGHSDTATSLAVHPTSLINLISASANGEIRIWDISKQRTIKSIQNAHNGFINGVCFDKVTKEHFYTIGTDKYLKRWKYKGSNTSDEPIQVYQAEYGLYCIDFHQDDNYLITGGDKLDLWDSNRSIPKQSFEPCMDSILSCKFNPVEKSLVLLSARNNGLYLYDIKSGTGISEFFMNKRTNQVCWNPMNPFVFSIANDDLNSYTFDMRKLEDGPTHMHVGHLGSVMSIDYSPTGQEFVTGSYDKTIRIYRTDTTNYNSREVYHTNRMQRVFQVKYTLDSRFILSSSDDYIVRIWKSKSSDPLRHTTIDEREKIEYNEKLIEKFKKLPEIRKISNQKYLPNKLYQEKKQYQQEREALERKEEKMNKKVIKSGGKIEKTNAMKKNFKGVSE